MLKVLIFWASYAYFPVALLSVWLVLRGGLSLRGRIAIGLFLSAISILAYARFIEPRIFNVAHAEIDLSNGAAETTDIRIALFADTHYGIFGNAMPMSRIVEQIQDEHVDAVFIAGDLIYHSKPDQIDSALAPLAQLDVPVFAVMGNHDVGFPGPDLTDPIFAALQGLNVTIVENRAIDTTIGDERVIVAGASDLWQRRYDFGFSADLPQDVPVILLAHNPDTASVVPDSFSYDLMLAGHTHGGQIRLPGLYKNAIPTNLPFDKGLHRYPSDSGERLVYVTPGTGMVGLPMRFLMPPRIDMITLTLAAPRDTPSPPQLRGLGTSETP